MADIEWDDLVAEPESEVEQMARQFIGAKKIFFRGDVIEANFGGCISSKVRYGFVTLEQVEEAERRSRPKNAKNGRPIYH